VQKQKLNTGVLHFAQDDGVKRARAKADPSALLRDDKGGVVVKGCCGEFEFEFGMYRNFVTVRVTYYDSSF
jgi:hypothetical protein